MTAAHMQSVAAMVAAMGAGQHAAMACGRRGDGGAPREEGGWQEAGAAQATFRATTEVLWGSSSSKRGKKRGANGGEQKTCVNCGVSRTPFWRKERVGGGSLCNACGLYLAKNDAPRPAMLWRRGGGGGAGAAEGAAAVGSVAGVGSSRARALEPTRFRSRPRGGCFAGSPGADCRGRGARRG